MTLKEWLQQRSGQLVSISLVGMSEWVEQFEGRMMLTGRMLAYEDFITLTAVSGTTSAVPYRHILTVDWSMEEQIEVEHITPDDFQ